MLALGLTAPMVSQMFASVGIAHAQPRPVFTPTKRGGGGALKVLWWQSPTLLNPHFAVGTKDQDGSRIFYEPLAAYDPDGNLVPILAAEIPSAQNGGLSKDGRSVTWRLKKNVAWHDGKPFTADDVVFNWEYAADPATAATTIGSYKDIERIDKIDSHTVKITFKKPLPFWAEAFCSNRGMIIPKHLFEAYRGRQVAGGAHQPQARGDRALQVRRLQARRHRPGRAQPELPHGEPPLLRHPGDEGRRGRRLRRPGRDPDRRNSTSPGTCRSKTRSCAAWSRAVGAGSTSRWPGTSSTSSATRPIPGKRSTASGRASRRPTPSSPIRPSARPSTSSSTEPPSRSRSTAGWARVSANFLNAPVALSLEEHEVGVQRRQGQPGSRGGGLEARAPTASGPRTARSSRWSSRPPSTHLARRRRPL